MTACPRELRKSTTHIGRTIKFWYPFMFSVTEKHYFKFANIPSQIVAGYS